MTDALRALDTGSALWHRRSPRAGVKHYGAEPPWEGEGEFGRWVRVQPDPRLWIREEPYWEWRPRRTTMEVINDVLRDIYTPALRAELQRDLDFLKGEGLVAF